MKNRYPTYEELRRLEANARRLRAEELRRLVLAARSALRNAFSVKGLRHA